MPKVYLRQMRKKCLSFCSQHYSNNPQTEFQLNLPNHVICLYHFEIIYRLLKCCHTDERHQEFISIYQRLTTDGHEIISDEIKVTERHQLIDYDFSYFMFFVVVSVFHDWSLSLDYILLVTAITLVPLITLSLRCVR